MQTSVRRKRVTGGRLAYPGELPGVGVILTKEPDSVSDATYSGGTGVLISSKYVLTTASLLRSKQKKGYVLHAVGFRANKRIENQYAIRIEKVIVHEDYHFGTYTNDIALLRLEKEVDFDAETNPICLPPIDNNDNDNDNKTLDSLKQEWSNCITSNLIGAGYGRKLEHLNTVPIYVNYIEMKNRPAEHCDRVYSRDIGKLGREKLCISSCLGENTGLCDNTDSGGPLMNSIITSDGRKQYTLYGLASYFVNCGIQSLPAIYTNVEAFIPWILDNIQP